MTTSYEEGSVLSHDDLKHSLQVMHIAGHQVTITALKHMLPTTEVALFFAKVYRLDYYQLGTLLRELFNTDPIAAIFGEGHVHSTSLQDYIVDTVPPHIVAQYGAAQYDPDAAAPDSDLLVKMFEEAQIEVAKSIQDLVDKLGDVLDTFPSKYGEMTFGHMYRLNRQYSAIGTYDAQIVHKLTPPRLVVLDVSGSMTSGTIRRIVEPVVALAYEINASLAIVSTTATLWEAGTFGVQDILDEAEYGGTQYETLAPIFNQDWETVITIADYDSSGDAKSYLKCNCTGHISQVMDLSVVGKPTFLAECLGQFAGKVTPLLVSSGGFLR